MKMNSASTRTAYFAPIGVRSIQKKRRKRYADSTSRRRDSMVERFIDIMFAIIMLAVAIFMLGGVVFVVYLLAYIFGG